MAWPECPLACSAASSASSSSIAASARAACTACPACTACGATAAAGCGAAACCRMRAAVAVCLWISAYSRAVSPSSSSRSVLALARSRAFTHASCPPPAAPMRANEHDGEVAYERSIHERRVAEVGRQVDGRALLQQVPHNLQVAAAGRGVQQGRGWCPTTASWSRPERVDRASLAQPLDHLRRLAVLRRLVDLKGKRGGRVHRGLVR
eukprot:scaffold21871_cov64-Phaeocystis_antarctica.AAC.2